MQFLTPRFFDILILVIILVGLVLAARRIIMDFQRGPRWPKGPDSGAEKLPDLPSDAPDGER